MESIMGTDMETRSEKTGRVLINEFPFSTVSFSIDIIPFLKIKKPYACLNSETGKPYDFTVTVFGLRRLSYHIKDMKSNMEEADSRFREKLPSVIPELSENAQVLEKDLETEKD